MTGKRRSLTLQNSFVFADWRLMLAKNYNHAWICSQLGHSDLTMLSKHHGRWIETAVNSSGSKAEQLFGTSYQNDGTI